MALATLIEMNTTCSGLLLAPPGPIHAEARRYGVQSLSFTSGRELAARLRPILARHHRLAFLATGVVHSFVLGLWNWWYRRDVAHLHLVHGGAEDAQSYGRKCWLQRANVAFVAVSSFVKDRLIAHGVPAHRITVIENFLPTTSERVVKRRTPFTRSGLERVVLISRLDPLKRVDLLLDALDLAPDLHSLSFRILGTGGDAEQLRARAARHHPNVTFAGFTPEAAEELAASDLLVHCCPVEPFGLVLLEAMAAGVPVLAPDSGNTASVIADGVSGFHFHANDAASLAERLRALRTLSAERLHEVVNEGKRTLALRFSPRDRVADYQRLISESFSHEMRGRA